MNRGFFNKYRFLLFSFMLLLYASCSKEQLAGVNDGGEGNPVEVRLNVGAKSTNSISSNETDINRLRVVVFGSLGSSDAGRLIMNKFYATAPVGNVLKEVITSGRRDIFIIVNEPLSGGGEELESYKSIASVSDVRNLSLIYDGAGSLAVYSPSEIPMFIEHINKQVLVDNPNEVSGEVERVMAKVSVKLNVKHSIFPTGKHVVIDNITIKNLPQSSSWIAKNYSSTLVASEKQSMVAVAPVSDYDVSSNNTFYVPEYIFNNADNGAYIEILGHINGEPSRIAKYIVKLGDAMDDAGRYGDKYNITRNRHYTFTGDVKSYGEMEDLAVKVTVLPWNTVNMEEEVGHYVSFSKVTNASNAVIADGSNLDDMGQTIRVSCNTNIGGWYAVVRNAKGGVVHTSTPTAAVSVATVQTINVVVPKLAPPYYMDNYTVSVYHSTIAQESVGPAKELKFTQYGSFIPNSVLLAAGWPVDILPIEGGLQVAARGDGVLPGGTPGAADPIMQCKTSSTPTSGVESFLSFANAKLGLGKSSTDAMTIPSQIDLHPAAKYCRTMGPEWYLPSVAELKLIYTNKSLLGASYAFIIWIYWSATEYGGGNGWDVNFKDGGESRLIKAGINLNRVRCVRGMPAPPPSGSYIPTSVLAIAGWPADRLPKTGLQVATRGNVMLGGTPATNDPRMAWSMEHVATGITTAGLGKGKENYAQLAAKDGTLYPIGQACTHLGSEWYVSSKDELSLIYNNRSLFGASYALNSEHYWSATEIDTHYSWYVNFGSGYTSGSNKTNPIRVRCVREI